MIYLTNWHTPYTIMLTEIFDSVVICGEWDYDQRELPKNCELVGFSRIPYRNLKESDVFIFNHAPSDITRILKTLFFTRSKIVLVVHGELERVRGGFLKKITKKIFYRMLAKIIEFRGTVVCIQEKVKDSYSFSKSAVTIEPFYVDTGYKNKSSQMNRFLLVANSFRREHFNKELPRLIKKYGFNIDLIGRDNEDFKSEFNLITPSNQDEYFNELASGGVYLNVLTKPEAPYNLTLLDAIGIGLPIVELERSDSVVQNPIARVSNFKEVNREVIKDWLEQQDFYAHSNKEILETRFSKVRFKKMWERVVGFDIS